MVSRRYFWLPETSDLSGNFWWFTQLDIDWPLLEPFSHLQPISPLKRISLANQAFGKDYSLPHMMNWSHDFSSKNLSYDCPPIPVETWNHPVPSRSKAIKANLLPNIIDIWLICIFSISLAEKNLIPVDLKELQNPAYFKNIPNQF